MYNYINIYTIFYNYIIQVFIHKIHIIIIDWVLQAQILYLELSVYLFFKNFLKLFKISVSTLKNASHFFLLRSYLAQISASMIRENPSRWAGGVITTSYFGKTKKRKYTCVFKQPSQHISDHSS